jgi:pyruvate ferredoxin oxidoreductase delta subunit
MSSETKQDRKIRPEVLKTDQEKADKEKNGLNISRCRTCQPGSTLKNKTGGWRNFRPVYIYEKCTKCGICEIVCPDMAVKPREDGFFEYDYDYCKGCGVCANECPAKAIEMILEEK